MQTVAADGQASAAGQGARRRDRRARRDGSRADVTAAADALLRPDRPHRHPGRQCRNRPLGRRRRGDAEDEHWLNVVDVNLNGVFWCNRAFGRHMLAAGRGSIVNIGSMSGFIVNRPQKQAYYNASKAAVHHLTKSLAAEWAPHGVRGQRGRADPYRDAADEVRAHDDARHGRGLARRYADGPGSASRTRSPRWCIFLASDAASLMTGSIVQADGGFTCW